MLEDVTIWFWIMQLIDLRTGGKHIHILIELFREKSEVFILI